MDSNEWLTSTDPVAMLDYVRSQASDRKLRLFACACCRQVWHLLTDERSRMAVEVAEHYANEQATADELAAAWAAAWAATWAAARDAARDAAWAAAWAATWAAARDAAKDAADAAWDAADAAWDAAKDAADAAWDATWAAARDAARDAAWDAARAKQAALLRCFFGNPWRPNTWAMLPEGWLTWQDGTIPRLAQAIYQDRAFERMPILADALEEAGCDNEDILTHLRGPSPHARGCFVLDLLLGKE